MQKKAKRMGWPKNCVWPEPIGKNGGIWWDVDMLPWENDLNQCMNELKIDVSSGKNCGNEDIDDSADPIGFISEVLGYSFINENLLRQAFTRRAFQVEYGLSGCSEELEFIGDSLLSVVVTKELVKELTGVRREQTDAPFDSDCDEGELSRLKARFVCKEHLASRCDFLGLDRFILYGTGEEVTESAKEDTIEAIIGAVAMDCNWDMEVLEDVTDKLINIQIDHPKSWTNLNYYDTFNHWHLKKIGIQPEYAIDRNLNMKNNGCEYICTLRFQVPDNDKGIRTSQIQVMAAESRSEARELAAEMAYRFVVNHGLWMNLKDANIAPDIENSINQLQELCQKRYISQAEYTFQLEEKCVFDSKLAENEIDGGLKSKKYWECTCQVDGISEKGCSYQKAAAKKKAAYCTLVKILESAGVCQKEWKDRVYNMPWLEDNWNDLGVQEERKNLEDCESQKNQMFQKKKAELIGYETVKEILLKVPFGKLITEAELIEEVKRTEQEKGTEQVKETERVKGSEQGEYRIHWKEIPPVEERTPEIPWHRLVTNKRLADARYKDVLEAEGHKLVETKSGKVRVIREE